MARADSNGSFYVSRGGFKYTGNRGADDNQIVTYDPDLEAVTATDLGNLFGGACVSQYEPSAPTTRPRGGELEIGDFWTDTGSKLLHIWDGDEWVLVKTINGNPVGTIIQSFNTVALTAPPGYLFCRRFSIR